MIEPKTEKLIEKWCPDDRKTDLIQQRIQRDSVDFRDLLMARGFGELEAHTRWWKEAIATGKID